jgi:NADH-quinone oxidoreductase subunit L
VGDVGLALGVMTVFLVFGSVNFDTVFSSIIENSDRRLSFLSFEINALELIAALLFIGAMGKSAQFLLHVWLPDAMEGTNPCFSFNPRCYNGDSWSIFDLSYISNI